jgi:NAD-dependent deacetylase
MKDIDKLINLIKTSSQTTVLTGAGISTLSGIKDFRSSNGMYSKKYKHLNVEEILNYEFFFSNPEIFYSWAKDNWYDMEKYEPNIVHNTLTKLQNLNLVGDIFTQNIDMLHTKANSKNIYEVHGSIKDHYCTKCNRTYSYEEIAPIVKKGQVPRCKVCNGLIKPKIVFYGESLDYGILERAYKSFSKSDLAIVLGSSLVVQPAASFIMYTINNGGKTVIVNKDPTSFDMYATLRFTDLKSTFDELNQNF